MSSPNRPVTEAILNINLNELAHTLVRELAMACRKVGIYGANHPMACKAIEKPFLAFNRIFGFKRCVSLNIQQGHLYALNIRLKESPFTDELIRHMQVLEVQALLFERRLTVTELTKFIDRFVRRVRLDDHSNLLSTFLRQNRIDTIEANTERAFTLFESQRQYRGDIGGDFSVKTAALHQMSDDLLRLATLRSDGEGALLPLNIDFTPEVIKYLMPERIASLPPEKFVDVLSELGAAASGEEASVSEEALAQYRSVWRLLDYHPDRDGIIERLQLVSKDSQMVREVAREAGDAVTAIRIETRDRVDELLAACLETRENYDSRQEFVGAFQRLLRTGQRGKATEVLSRLTDYLTSAEANFRGKSLELLMSVAGTTDLIGDEVIFGHITHLVEKVFAEAVETYEYAEFVWRLVERAITTGRFDLAAQLATIIGSRRKMVAGVPVFDSVGVKKIIENINRPEVISLLVDELVRPRGETTVAVRDILVNCGDEAAAVGLSQVISHPIRQVRQQALKILAELGKASLNVFTAILMDDSMFERDANRYELPDAKWYVVRNSIFVLGLLADEGGVIPLRLRINDKDVRVRREIIVTLEKIGGEDACDLLIVMADDPVLEIRERAVIAAGIIGTPDVAPLMIDVIKRNPSVALKGIGALGKLGGETSREFLGALLEDDGRLAALADERASRDDLRAAVVRALGEIGDDSSIDRLRQFRENMSAAQKIFFRHSSLNTALEEVLARR